jgi:3-isopropylmalate/(R)-2-methylmalate dehydratase small subunit
VKPFEKVSGPAAPLMLSNVDTDVIIRIERLTGDADLGRYAFEALRYLDDGSLNPRCVLNEPRFRHAPILLAGRNFGCGSSREGAVTALKALGFRVIIAPSYGDIFHENCFKNGMLPVVLPEAQVERLSALAAQNDVTVDLENCLVTSASGDVFQFSIDELHRVGLLEGLDELGLTLRLKDDIAAWQSSDRLARPWVWLPQEGGSS